MTTFQQLTSILSHQKRKEQHLRNLITDSWFKIHKKGLISNKFSTFILEAREALSDAQHFCCEGEHEYFDELVQRDLSC
jgi:hypothetical protein